MCKQVIVISPTSPIIDAYICCGRMGGNSNVKEIIASSQVGRGAGEERLF